LHQLEGFLDGSINLPAKIVEVVKDDNTKEMIPNALYATWLTHD
jgi:hypothetical protein